MEHSSRLERVTRLPQLPPRPDDAHKGTFGRALIVAGSRGMSGAASLAGLGALRGGAGLVSIAVPAGILPIVAAVEPSYLTIPLPEDRRGGGAAGGRGGVSAARQVLSDELPRCTAFAVGPGIGRSKSLSQLAEWLYVEADQPAVFDADALNGLADVAYVFAARTKARAGGPARVL